MPGTEAPPRAPRPRPSTAAIIAMSIFLADVLGCCAERKAPSAHGDLSTLLRKSEPAIVDDETAAPEKRYPQSRQSPRSWMTTRRRRQMLHQPRRRRLLTNSATLPTRRDARALSTASHGHHGSSHRMPTGQVDTALQGPGEGVRRSRRPPLPRLRLHAQSADLRRLRRGCRHAHQIRGDGRKVRAAKVDVRRRKDGRVYTVFTVHVLIIGLLYTRPHTPDTPLRLLTTTHTAHTLNTDARRP